MKYTSIIQRRAEETRRDFIKKSAAAAALFSGAPLFGPMLRADSRQGAVSAGASAAANPSGGGDRLAVATIGHGSQGMALLRTLKATEGETNVRIAAVCDLWSKRLNQARETAGLSDSDAYTDYRRILERDDIDAVLIATPTHTHAAIAVEAMEAGKHVYVEKPMTRYLHEAFAVYDTAKRTGKVLQVGMQWASEPRWIRSGEIIREGGIGPLVLAQASYMRNSGARGEWNVNIDPELTEGDVDWDAWLGPVPDQPFSADTFFRWRKYYPYSTGIMGDLLPHRLGPLMIATGKPEFPRRVVCLGTRKIQTDRDVSDNLQILAEFPSGLTMVLLGSSVNEQGLPDRIRGHHATISIGADRISLSPERPFVEEVDSLTETGLNYPNPLDMHMRNWYDAIRHAGQPSAGAEVGVRMDTVLALAEMSERLNTMCLFDEETRKVTTGEGREVEPLTHGMLESRRIG